MKVGIVGAGIMGQLLGFTLVNAGYTVSIFDKDSISNCSMAAVGMLSPISELEKADLAIYQVGMDAIKQHWPSILNKLNENIYFETSGTIALSHPRDRAELTRFIHAIDAKLNVKHSMLNHHQFKQLEPELAKFEDVYYFAEEGHLDNQTLLQKLHQYLCEKGVKWEEEALIDETCSVKVNNKLFDRVFDCRGMGAKSVFHDLHGVRGEIIWLHAPEVKINHPIRFMHPRYSIYIAPRPDDVYLVGASEINSENYAEITVRTTLELLTAVYYLHPGFAEAQIIKTITQCRPTLSDYLPKIKYADGFIAVNGLYRHGYLLAPTLAAEIMQFLQHGAASLRYPQWWEKYNDYN